MNPKIKELIEELRHPAIVQGADGYPRLNEYKALRSMANAASILQAVFDPENQPSQYGTTLLTK